MFMTKNDAFILRQAMTAVGMEELHKEITMTTFDRRFRDRTCFRLRMEEAQELVVREALEHARQTFTELTGRKQAARLANKIAKLKVLTF